jgi:hypothetical protein
LLQQDIQLSFQNLVNSGIDLAIYQDKLPDAIKEFALSVNDKLKVFLMP